MKATIEFDLANEADRRALEAALSAADQAREPVQPIEEPDFGTPEHELVYQTVVDQPGHALRIYHELLVDNPAADFSGPIEDNDERERLQEILWELRRDGLLTVEGRVWQPVERRSSSLDEFVPTRNEDDGQDGQPMSE